MGKSDLTERNNKTGDSEGELLGCWVSPGWSDGLTTQPRSDWPDVKRPEEGTSGVVTVLVARQRSDQRVSVCGYLVDTYCLGVKDTLGPLSVPAEEMSGFREEYFAAYHAPPLSVPLELARQLVFGAVDYARGLGFQPHEDFAAAATHLGKWSGQSVITFGRNGKPLFVQGANDDAGEIMKTLDRTVGRGKYDFLVLT